MFENWWEDNKGRLLGDPDLIAEESWNAGWNAALKQLKGAIEAGVETFGGQKGG